MVRAQTTALTILSAATLGAFTRSDSFIRHSHPTLCSPPCHPALPANKTRHLRNRAAVVQRTRCFHTSGSNSRHQLTITTLAGFGGGARGADTTWPETAPTVKKLFSRETRAGFFSCRPRAPAFRALKKSEKNGSNSRHQLTITTLAGFGGGVRGADTTWPETAPTVKKTLFTRDPRGFVFMPPTRARLPGLQKIGENWLGYSTAIHDHWWQRDGGCGWVLMCVAKRAEVE